MKVLVAGLGAVGSIYATKFKDAGYDVRVLVDECRLSLYESGTFFNNKRYDFEYVLKGEEEFKPGLIVVAVKAGALGEVVENLANFVEEGTVILSLLNGISSEEVIRAKYLKARVLTSYYVGHASVRNGRKVFYDGIGRIVCEKDDWLRKIFDRAGVEYEFAENIQSALWQKFIINIGVNQTTAMLRGTYACFEDLNAMEIAKSLMEEGVEIAKRIGISGHEKFIENAFKLIDEMPRELKTSMYQDIEKGIATEVDIFAGEVCRLGHAHGVETPCNEIAYGVIKKMELEAK